MNLLIIEQSEELRTDIRRRIEEASRSTGLRGFTIEALEMKQLGSSTPDLIILGSFAKDTILEIHSRLNSIYPNVPVILLLNTDDYLEDAVELHKRTMIRIVALGDLPQISQILINLGQPIDRSTDFIGKARIISLVSVKGGVGTTTLSASLASFYQEHGISTLLIDLNYANRDLSAFSQYSIEGQSALSQAFKIASPEFKHIQPCIEKFRGIQNSPTSIIGSPESYLEGFQLFTNKLPISEINAGWLESTISVLAGEFETIIIDIGNHWGPSALSSLALSSHVGLVVEEDEWCMKRSVAMMQKLSSESDDPGEFDFRKWKFLVNGMISNATAMEILSKHNEDYQLIKNPTLFGFPWSKKCLNWLMGQNTAYELGEQNYRDAIEQFGKSVRPF